jgi:hypothetical protein
VENIDLSGVTGILPLRYIYSTLATRVFFCQCPVISIIKTNFSIRNQGYLKEVRINTFHKLSYTSGMAGWKAPVLGSSPVFTVQILSCHKNK